MRFSLRVNNDVSVDGFGEIARAAERHGFDQVWVSNDLFLRPAPVLLTAAAIRTERIHLGCGVFNPYSIHPAEIAMTVAGLQEVSDGRALVGVGAGAEEFLHAAGIARPAPLRRTREAVVALRALLAGRRPASILDDWGEDGYLRFPSVPTPVYVGAMGPRMQEMTGEVADGALPLLFPPEHFPVVRDHIRAGAYRTGRDVEDLDLAACVWVSIDRDRDLARQALAEKIAYYGPSISPHLWEPLGVTPKDLASVRSAMATGGVDAARRQVTEAMLRIGIAGDADEVGRRCEWLVEAGARHLSFGPPLGPDPMAAIEQIGERILPRFRDL